MRNLVSGKLFGEVALLFQTKRTASVRCKDQCTLAGLNEEHFRNLMRIYPEVKKALMQGTKRYKDHWKLFQIGVLSQVDYFEDIPFKTKEDLHYKIQL